MAEQSTGVKYAISIDDTELRRAAQESAKVFDDIASQAVRSGEKMDSIFDKAAASAAGAVDDFASLSDQIKFQKDIISGLEKDLKVLEEAYKNAAPGRDWADAVSKFNSAKAELQGEKQALEELEAQAKSTANSQVSMRTRMREVREELIALEAAGKRGTDEYRKLQEEAGKLQDAYADASAQMRIMAHDQRGLQGIISGLTGLSAAFSAASGVVGLFTKDNEKLQQAMLRVQSLMSITVGLQQIQQTLNKDSAFRLVIINGLKEWWVKTTQKATVAMAAETAAVKAGGTAATGAAGAFRLLGAAIKSIPGVGWLIAALTAAAAAVTVITKRLKGQAEELKKSREEAAELKKTVNESAAKSVSGIMELSRSYKRLGDDMQAKQRFIEENKRAFDDLGVSVANVADAENLLINNTDKFIEAEKARAVAVALRERAQKIIAENLDALIFDEGSVKQPDVDYKDNAQYAEYLKKNTETLNKGLSYRKKTVEKQLDELYKMISDKDSEFNKLMSGFHTNAASNVTANVSNDIEAAKKAYEDGKKKIKDYEAELNEKLTENDILLERDATQRRIKEINLREERELNALKEFGEKVLAQERENAKNRALITGEAYDEKTVTLPEGFQQMIDLVTKQVTENAQRQRDAVIKEARRAYEELAAEYADLEGKIAAIREKYDKQLETAGGDSSLVSKIRETQRREIAALVLDSFRAEESIGKVAEQVQSLGKAARSALQSNLQKIVDFVTRRKAQNGLPEQLKESVADFAALNNVSAEFLNRLLETDGAFEAFAEYVENLGRETAEPIDNITDAIKNFKAAKEKATQSGDIIDIDNLEYAQELLNDMTMQLANNILNTADAIAQMFREIAEMTGNEAFAKAGDVMADIVGNLQAAEQGAQAWGGWWGAIIGGLTDLIPKIIKWVNMGNKDSIEYLDREIAASKSMIDYWRQIYEEGAGWVTPDFTETGRRMTELIEKLKKAEAEYGKAIAFGSDKKLEGIQDYIDSLKAAIAEIKKEFREGVEVSSYQAFHKMLDEYDRQIAAYESRIDALNEHPKKNAEEIAQAYIELAQLIQDEADAVVAHAESVIGKSTSEIGNDIYTMIKDAFEAGKDSVDDFGRYFNNMVYEMLLNNVVMKALEKQLQKYINMLSEGVDAYFEGNVGQDYLSGLIDWVGKGIKGVVDETYAMIRDTELGDMIEGYRQQGQETTAQGKGIATASQDTVDELNGRMTVVQANTTELLENSALNLQYTSSILSVVSNIKNDTWAMRNDIGDMLGEVRSIRTIVDGL